MVIRKKRCDTFVLNRMGIFDSLFKAKYNWEDVKHSEQVYPINTISLLSIKTENVELTTGWIDKGYDEYEFKKCCPYNFLITIHCKENNSNADLLVIENCFADTLREVCIAHMIARVVSKDNVSIEMYVDDKAAAEEQLKIIQKDTSLNFSFEWEVTHDPKWKLVKGLMDL